MYHVSPLQTESPSGKDLSLLGVYLLGSMLFVFAALAEFAYVLFVKQKQEWLDNDDKYEADGSRSSKRPSSGVNAVSSDLVDVDRETSQVGNVQQTITQETRKTPSFWSKKCTMLQDLPLTTQIDFTGFVLFNFFYLLFNFVYWVYVLG